MVKNTTGGKHHKKQKRGENDINTRNIPWADNVVTFCGKVTTLYGANMIEVTIDDTGHKCRIPGSFRKRVWIGKGDIVLVHFDKDCGIYEVTFVYKASEVDMMRVMGIWTDINTECEQTGETDQVWFTNEKELDIATI